VKILQQTAVDAKDIPSIAKYQQNRRKLSAEQKQLIDVRNKIRTEIKNNENAFLNKQNAHILTRNKPQQLSIDVNPSSANGRGLKRAVFDYDINHSKKRIEFMVDRIIINIMQIKIVI
jgi:hypothetical protein